MKIQRALISVFDKMGIEEFALFLHMQGVEIVSTGGTATLLRSKDIPVKDVSDITEFPEMLDGRVKTLHPNIHGGILFVRGNDDHEKTIKEHTIGAIDMVVVNLYPFEDTLSSGASDEEIIENIDIGGPSMLRSAAKNFQGVTAICDPNDYSVVQKEIEEKSNVTLETRKHLAGKVFEKTARYDAAIAGYFNSNLVSTFATKIMDLKYGENPHQLGEFFLSGAQEGPSIASAEQLQGKKLGYCNIVDADAALNLVLEFDEPSVAIIKHATPCGVASGFDILDAYERALACDSLSAFGGVVAVSGVVDEALAQEIKKIFLEVIIAPEFSKEAQKILSQKPNLRLLATGDMKNVRGLKETRSIRGGYVVQDKDESKVTEKELDVVVGKVNQDEIKDLLFAWKVVKHVKSNAIVLVKDGRTVGIGAGQTSRVGSSKIATEQAGEFAKGAVAASDAFFPFPDGVESLAGAGISAIIQPGGSRKDDEVFAAAEKAGVAMVLTGVRAFKH